MKKNEKLTIEHKLINRLGAISGRLKYWRNASKNLGLSHVMVSFKDINNILEEIQEEEKFIHNLKTNNETKGG